MATRPNITLAVKRLVRDAAARLPELAHVRASAVLVVAGEARGVSRASIGPATGRQGGRRRRLTLQGRRLLYVMTLRPLWFLASTPEERIATVLHELYHCAARFDGSLDHSRKHARLPRHAYDARIQDLLGRYLARAPHELLAPFAHQGLVRARMWLRRPRPGARAPAERDAAPDLFYGLLPLGAAPAARRGRELP